MYKIFSDGYIVYHPMLPESIIISGKLDLEVNKAGTLTFTIPESNPHYGMIELMKSIVELYDDDRLIFRGRPYAPSRNLYKDTEIVCEGELAFFNDTYQEPFEYYGTVNDLFTKAVNYHNSQVPEQKQFKVGMVNVTNNTIEGYITRSSVDYQNTWQFIEDNFLEPLGGYLYLRHEEDGTYIDYLSDLNFPSGQSVQQCLNLVEVSEEVTADELATVIVPLGAKLTDDEGNETDKYTTVESVNAGKIYVSDLKGIEEYGYIVKITNHNDITDPINLKKAGEADLAASMGVTTTIDLSAADLSKAGYNVSPFSFGTYVPVKIKNLGVDKSMLIKKLSIDLLNPQSSNISVGDSIKSFTAKSLNTNKTIGIIQNNLAHEKVIVNQTISQIQKEMMSSLEQTEEYILSTVTEGYFSKEQTEELLSQMSTQIEQNAGAIEIRFEQLQKEVTEVGDTIVAQNQFIRLENGEVIIGKSDSPIVSVYTNNALEFRYNGVTVAKFTNEVLEVRNINIENQLKLHNRWAFRRGEYQAGKGHNLNVVWLG